MLYSLRIREGVFSETHLQPVAEAAKLFRRYSATYYDPGNPEDNAVEQGTTQHAALENLYHTLERKGFSRETLPKPRWPFRGSP
jgi:hypothetical protein